MSPRTFDDIPVSTVFAEEKSRESENSDTRKSTTSLRSQNSRKISRESRDSKKSKKSEKSENEPDQESVETAKKLKKELEDTIRNHFRKTIKVHTSNRFFPYEMDLKTVQKGCDRDRSCDKICIYRFQNGPIIAFLLSWAILKFLTSMT